MKRKGLISSLLVCLLALGLMFISCDNGSSELNDPKSIQIANITGLTGRAGVWLFTELPQPGAAPTNTAIQSGSIVNGSLTLNLVVPQDNTWNSGPAWTGHGDYYVWIIPIVNNSYSSSNIWIYVGDKGTPTKVTFDKAMTTLSFNQFARVQ